MQIAVDALGTSSVGTSTSALPADASFSATADVVVTAASESQPAARSVAMCSVSLLICCSAACSQGSGSCRIGWMLSNVLLFH